VVNDLLTAQEHSSFPWQGKESGFIMLEQAITELQNIEQSVARKTLSDLQIRLALRSCLKELRALCIACPPQPLSSLAAERRPGSSSK
jgi:hypothetical protein